MPREAAVPEPAFPKQSNSIAVNTPQPQSTTRNYVSEGRAAYLWISAHDELLTSRDAVAEQINEDAN